MSEFNVCIFKVEKLLPEIIILLKKKYYKPIDELDGFAVDISEKSCIYKWEGINNNSFNIQSSIIDGTTFEYVEAMACMEVIGMTRAKREQIGAVVALNKGMLVETKKSKVLFVNYLGGTYCIVCGPAGLEGKIRSTLMETRERSQSEWGPVYFNNLKEYSFGKSLYYWIIDKKGQDINKDNDIAKIIDVKGFKSDTERDSSSFSGERANIDRRIPLKSIISMGERLVNLYINMNFNNVTYSFVLHNDGRVTLFLSECGVFGSTNIRALSFEEAILSIYFIIIPFLKAKFNEVGIEHWDEHEIRIKKNYSIDIILKLMRENSIKLEDIEIAHVATN